MINIEKITMIFNPGTVNENTAINKLSLKINEGDFITVIGSNGAGKSTLFNLVSGNITPASGTVSINGKNITQMPEYKRAAFIGRIFQNPTMGTAANMSLEHNMMLAYKKGFKWPVISLNAKLKEYFKTRLAELEMQLENRLKDNVGLFSGGQRQALTLLMMVMSKPALVLLDEHTAALDPRNAQKVLELTTKFIKEYKLTVMMITHNMNHAIEYGNRLLMMDEGEIIFEAEGDEKKKLTVEKLVKKFHEIKKKDFGNDETLLSEDIN
jgi:putative ABC transport system ATP-binding protein